MGHEFEVLMDLLAMRLDDSAPVLQRFAALSGAISHLDGGKNNFVYIPGTREDRVVLIAHADTVWDTFYYPDYPDHIKKLQAAEHKPVYDAETDLITQGGWNEWGIGADDRAGCAILWLLKESGHSLLVTDGEEYHQIGANYLTEQYPDISAELNAHRYMIQFDRCNGQDYKTYRLPVTEAFTNYIEERTHYENAGRSARTDIVALCKRCCGVNLSVGYYREHTPHESLRFREWLHTVNVAKELLASEQPQFLLQESLS